MPHILVVALMSYGYNREELVKRAARQIDRILKGAKPYGLIAPASIPSPLAIR
jgi:hypothetical protein